MGLSISCELSGIFLSVVVKGLTPFSHELIDTADYCQGLFMLVSMLNAPNSVTEITCRW